jgi:hypothetical protein
MRRFRVVLVLLLVVAVDANTGKVGPATAGKSALLPPLPVIRG